MNYRENDGAGNAIDSPDTFAIVSRDGTHVIGMFTEFPQVYYDSMGNERLNWSITKEVFDFQRDGMMSPAEGMGFKVSP